MAAGVFFLLLLIIVGGAFLFWLPRRIAKKILSTLALLGVGLLLAALLRGFLDHHLILPMRAFCLLLFAALTYLSIWLVGRIFGKTPITQASAERLPFISFPRLSGWHLIAVSLGLGFLCLMILTASEGQRITDGESFLMALLFAAVIGLFVWGLIRLQRPVVPSAAQAACPPLGRLKDLLAERLPRGERVRLAAHLELCSLCQHRVEGMTAGHHSWPGMARKLSEHQRLPEPALRKVMDRLKDHSPEMTRDEPALAGDLPLGFLTPTDKPGQLGRLERYEVLEEIGRGGMGVVLKAFDPSLHRVVAIKVLAPQLATSGVARKRFLREAKSAAAVTHDHIVAIHSVDEANGLPYLVMQYVAGQSLQDRIDKDGPLELPDLLRIGMQTASGLAAAHAHGIVHRDIKPANILLEEGIQRVKITDFGLARAMDDASLTQSGFVAGSPLYMAPEQARGEALDHRADLFSLGSVLYTMCTGRPPFRAANTLAVLRRVSEDTPRPIRETNPEIPEWLADIVMKLMAKEPTERFPSAAEVEELLGKHLAQLQHGSWVPPTRSPSPGAENGALAGLPTSLTICPSCGASLHVPERMVGSIVHCAECGKPFHVEEGSEVIQVAQAVPPLPGLQPRTRRRFPRKLWIAAGCALFFFIPFILYNLRSENHPPTVTKKSTRPATSGRMTINKSMALSEHPEITRVLPWRDTLGWLPGEAMLFGTMVFWPFNSLTLDDPFTRTIVRLFVNEDTADRLTTENLGRIRIDGVSLAYYEETKKEKARLLVHVEGLALDGRKRLIDFIRRENEDKVLIEEKQITNVTGQSARVSGPDLPFAAGIYDDQHVFLASALHRNANQAQHVQALEHISWFDFPKGQKTTSGVLSGCNPPWIQAALTTIPPDACAVFIGEIPAEARRLLTKTLKLRACPRSFVFEMRRKNEGGFTIGLSLIVDKAGAEVLLMKDLDKWRQKALDVLKAKFPAVMKEKQALNMLTQTLQQVRWEAHSGSKCVRTTIQIPAPTWKALGEILKQIAKTHQED